jgi:hypothetical protein
MTRNTFPAPADDNTVPAEWVNRYSLSRDEHIDWARIRRDLVEAGVIAATKATPETLLTILGVRR